jgi:aryl-alcohol dehydrogenase-like predicted oxidoreductase
MTTTTSGATPEGTERAAAHGRATGLPAFAYRPFGRTGLTASALGFGTYRVDERTPEHGASLSLALERRINLIDTSTNYTDGSSERTIGAVLAGRRREETIVVSKVGYVQGQTLALARTRERNGEPFGDMVKYMEGCWHCLHPGFVADQLGRSLERLRLATIDVYLLHNPEYFFADAVKRQQAGNLGALRDSFYERVGRAFAHLEGEVQRGRIAWYGVSSNTFGAAPDDPAATSLDRMHAIAERIARQHHFAVVQLAANLFESGPMLTRNNAGGTLTVLEFAAAKNLAVLANRPLNAHKDERLVRLADGVAPKGLRADAAQRGRAGDAALHTALNAHLPTELHAASLSQKAMAALVHTPGITSVLNGMRRREYVDDALGALGGRDFRTPAALYQALS